MLVRATCSDTMGLGTSAEALACGGSLARYVRALGNARLPAESSVNGVPAQNFAARSAKSYLSVNAVEQRRRAEMSCARIGLTRSGGGFDDCVSELRYEIAYAGHWPGT